MIRYMLFCLLGALSLPGADAADLMLELQARLAQPAMLRGQFEQHKSLPGFKKPLISSGEFLLWRGHGVLWHTRKPFDSLLVLRRDGLLATQQDGRTAYQMDMQREPGLRTVNELLFALFTADVTGLQKHFNIEGTLSGKQAWRLVMTPSGTGSAQLFRRVELEGERHVRRVKLEETNGDTSLIYFDNQSETPLATREEASRLGN